MTATVISVKPDDLDKVEGCPAAVALANLAEVHRIPIEHAYLATTHAADDPNTLVVTVSHESAEAWRAALGAPSFTAKETAYSTQRTTEVFWFGAKVRLSYSTF